MIFITWKVITGCIHIAFSMSLFMHVTSPELAMSYSVYCLVRKLSKHIKQTLLPDSQAVCVQVPFSTFSLKYMYVLSHCVSCGAWRGLIVRCVAVLFLVARWCQVAHTGKGCWFSVQIQPGSYMSDQLQSRHVSPSV